MVVMVVMVMVFMVVIDMVIEERIVVRLGSGKRPSDCKAPGDGQKGLTWTDPDLPHHGATLHVMCYFPGAFQGERRLPGFDR